MLLSFTVSNFKCFKQHQTLQLASKHYNNSSYCKTKEISNDVFETEGVNKATIVYGAPNGGKTALIEALEFAIDFIKHSASNSPISKINFSSNVANESTIPSFFEFTFCHEGCIYTYNFDLHENGIKQEYLIEHICAVYEEAEEDYVCLIERQDGAIKVNEAEVGFLNAIINDGVINDKQLLLSLLVSLNCKLANSLVAAISKYKVYYFSEDSGDLFKYAAYTLKKDLKNLAPLYLELLNQFGFYIRDIWSYNDNDFIDGDSSFDVKSKRFEYNKPIPDYKVIVSYGDKNNPELTTFGALISDKYSSLHKAFCLAHILIEAIKKGHTVFIDDLAVHFDTNMVRNILNIVHKVDAPFQLIFTTKDPLLLKYTDLTEDQIYFVQQKRDIDDGYLCSSLCDMSMYNKIRFDPISSDYDNGGKLEDPDSFIGRFLENRYSTTVNISKNFDTSLFIEND